MEEIRMTLKGGASAPSYAGAGSAGADVRAYLPDGVVKIEPGKAVLIPTGICAAIPEGYEIQVRPRSGLALKKSITVLNTPGTIDSDYRGEIGIILINHSDAPFTVSHGDRIAQLVFARYSSAVYTVVSELDETQRGSGGFGSTGV